MQSKTTRRLAIVLTLLATVLMGGVGLFLFTQLNQDQSAEDAAAGEEDFIAVAPQSDQAVNNDGVCRIGYYTNHRGLDYVNRNPGYDPSTAGAAAFTPTLQLNELRNYADDRGYELKDFFGPGYRFIGDPGLPSESPASDYQVINSIPAFDGTARSEPLDILFVADADNGFVHSNNAPNTGASGFLNGFRIEGAYTNNSLEALTLDNALNTWKFGGNIVVVGGSSWEGPTTTGLSGGTSSLPNRDVFSPFDFSTLLPDGLANNYNVGSFTAAPFTNRLLGGVYMVSDADLRNGVASYSYLWGQPGGYYVRGNEGGVVTSRAQDILASRDIPYLSNINVDVATIGETYGRAPGALFVERDGEGPGECIAPLEYNEAFALSGSATATNPEANQSLSRGGVNPDNSYCLFMNVRPKIYSLTGSNPQWFADDRGADWGGAGFMLVDTIGGTAVKQNLDSIFDWIPDCSDTTTTDPDPVPNFDVTKTAASSAVEVGESITYNIELRYTGEAGGVIDDATLVDTFPSQLSFRDGSVQKISGGSGQVLFDTSNPDVTLSGNRLSITPTTLFAGETGLTEGEAFRISLNFVAESAGDGLENSVEVTSTDTDTPTTDTSTITITDPEVDPGEPAFTVTKTSLQPVYNLGDVVTYFLDLEYTGAPDGVIDDATLVDTFPTQLDFLNGSTQKTSESGADVVNFDGSDPNVSISGNTVTITPTTLFAGESEFTAGETFRITLNFNSLEVVSDVVNSVVVTSEDTTSDSTDTTSITIQTPPEPDFSLVKSVAQTDYLVGDTVTYTLELEYTGTETASVEGISVVDTFPTQLSFLDGSVQKEGGSPSDFTAATDGVTIAGNTITLATAVALNGETTLDFGEKFIITLNFEAVSAGAGIENVAVGESTNTTTDDDNSSTTTTNVTDTETQVVTLTCYGDCTTSLTDDRSGPDACVTTTVSGPIETVTCPAGTSETPTCFETAPGGQCPGETSTDTTADPVCDDGIDNDGDGLVDCTPGAEDPGCFPDGMGGDGACNPNDTSETDGVASNLPATNLNGDQLLAMAAGLLTLIMAVVVYRSGLVVDFLERQGVINSIDRARRVAPWKTYEDRVAGEMQNEVQERD